MQASRGLPLISIEHEPHLPALQFQRSARSLACWAWIRCSTSSTTMPGSTSMSYCWKSPPSRLPRQTLKIRFAIAVLLLRRGLLLHVRGDLAGFQVFDLGVVDRHQVRRAVGPQPLLDLHAVGALLDDHVVLDPLGALA